MKELILKISQENPTFGYLKIARIAGCSKHTARYHLNDKYKVRKNERVIVRSKDKKKALVSLHGGKCIVCGYSKNISALEFHHRYSDEKEFTLAKLCKSLANLIKEAEKCDLVCCRCHREIHNPNG